MSKNQERRYATLASALPTPAKQEIRADLEKDIEAFLADGGTIQKVPNGLTSVETSVKLRSHKFKAQGLKGKPKE